MGMMKAMRASGALVALVGSIVFVQRLPAEEPPAKQKSAASEDARARKKYTIERPYSIWDYERDRAEALARGEPDPDLVPQRPELQRKQFIAPPPDVAAPPADAEQTLLGVWTKQIEPGTGTEPVRLNDTVRLHYTGWTIDGVMFDTTQFDDEPVMHTVSRMLPGLTDGLQQMVEGETRRMWIPGYLATIDEQGAPSGMLVFDVTVTQIVGRGPVAPPNTAIVPPDAVQLDSGAAYRVERPGDGGEKPSLTDAVAVHVTVFHADGRAIDDSRSRRKPERFNLDTTIPGLREVIPTMTRGERRTVWLPEELANLSDPPTYTGTLVFDLELLDFFQEPETPKYVSAIPPDAEMTELGVAFRVLQPGTGTRRPQPNDTVVVQFSGWTSDGKRFDSSYDHGQPGEFVLDSRRPIGWNYALQQMVEGEKRRVWIPEELAYGGRSDRPKGMLVFDVELLEIK
jgi:peptidylprolyl isomerase